MPFGSKLDARPRWRDAGFKSLGMAVGEMAALLLVYRERRPQRLAAAGFQAGPSAAKAPPPKPRALAALSVLMGAGRAT
jgi:hypothetical protein